MQYMRTVATNGAGASYVESKKLCVNTTSSSTSELVAAREGLPKILWYRQFCICQGGVDDEDIELQDNTTTQLLENNGQLSAGKATRHITIRWFFITDMINQKEVVIRDYPTKNMWVDVVMKPLQGGLYTKFRNLIQGVNATGFSKYKKDYAMIIKQYELEDTCAQYDAVSANPQECVGD